MITKVIKKPEHQRELFDHAIVSSHTGINFRHTPYHSTKNLNTDKGCSNSDTSGNQPQSICTTSLHHKTSGILCSGRTANTTSRAGDGEAVGIRGGDDTCG